MTHWDEYTFDRKLRAFEAIGFAQGEAVKLADVSWDNFTSEVKRALKESDDTFFGTGIDDDKEYTDEEIEAENKKKEETGESYDYNNIGVNELQRTKYQCEFCNSGYKSNESLNVHLNDVHTQTLGDISGYGLSGEESSYYKRAKESDERCSDCGDMEDLDEYGKCSYCHEEAKEAKIPQGDLYQGGQKVGTIRDYNSKQHEGYVTLDGIGIEEFGAMTSDYEVRVNGERIPNKWDGKHDYNLDLFGEAGEKTEEEREADAMAFDALEEQGQSGNPYNIFKNKSKESDDKWCDQCGVAWRDHGINCTGEGSWFDYSPDHNADGTPKGESFAREDDPDFENDPDFEGKIGGKSVEPSQYTQSGMDHEDRSRGDIDFDGEAVRSCPACNYANDGRALSCVSCGEDFPSNEEPSIQAQETITTAFGNGMVYHTSEKGGTIEHAEDEWCSSCDDAHESKANEEVEYTGGDFCATCGTEFEDRGECKKCGESKAKEYDTKTNVWGSTSYSHIEKDVEEYFEDTYEDFHDGLMDYSNTCKICGEHVRQYDGWKKEKLQDHLLQAHGDMHGMESKAEDEDADFERDISKSDDDYDGFFEKTGQQKSEELFGQNDPDEILGGSWGTPENTKQDLYNSMPHNYPEGDYSKYEDMIISKMGSASTGQFSANALDLFLRNKGATSDDLINDLVMEYGKGTDPIW